MSEKVLLVDCPRDALQGQAKAIETAQKTAYLQLLLNTNYFDWLDFGSFVSPKAVPQMADTHEVCHGLDLSSSRTKLLAIVANERGAAEAVAYEAISYVGYPFSISETFQLRNTQANLAQSYERSKKIVEICQRANKTPVFYISMAFGNPYGEHWNIELVLDWVEKLAQLGISEFSLADTIGLAKTTDISLLFQKTLSAFPELRIGAHFHSNPLFWKEKIEAAYLAGCRKFEGAIAGYGGCPFAEDELVGNIPTEKLLEYFNIGDPETIQSLIAAFTKIL